MAQSVVSAKLGPFRGRVDAVLADIARKRIAARLWAKDHRLWKSDPTEIDNRLGWLTVAEQMEERVGPLTAFATSVRDDGFKHVVLLGMGGSSLGPEVLRCTFTPARGFPKLFVLDSTVPGAVCAVSKAIQPARTLFILASKVRRDHRSDVAVRALLGHGGAGKGKPPGKPIHRDYGPGYESSRLGA